MLPCMLLMRALCASQKRVHCHICDNLRLIQTECTPQETHCLAVWNQQCATYPICEGGTLPPPTQSRDISLPAGAGRQVNTMYAIKIHAWRARLQALLVPAADPLAPPSAEPAATPQTNGAPLRMARPRQDSDTKSKRQRVVSARNSAIGNGGCSLNESLSGCNEVEVIPYFTHPARQSRFHSLHVCTHLADWQDWPLSNANGMRYHLNTASTRAPASSAKTQQIRYTMIAQIDCMALQDWACPPSKSWSNTNLDTQMQQWHMSNILKAQWRTCLNSAQRHQSAISWLNTATCISSKANTNQHAPQKTMCTTGAKRSRSL